MTQTEQLIASLTASYDSNNDGLTGIDGDPDRYIDWSTRDGDRRAFEVGGDGDTASLWMTNDELRELHRRLTITLLADAT